MTDTASPTRSFKRGAEAAKAASTTQSFSRAGFFQLDDGDRAFVQFITDCDEWINVDTHPMLPTKARPADYQGDKWPEKIQSVCRLTTMGDGLPLYGDCYVCENIPDPKDPTKPFKKVARTYALGVILDEVIGDGSAATGGPAKMGKRSGYRMKKVEFVDPETKQSTLVPDVNVFTFGWGNFYAALEGAAQVNDGTICNLIFAIKRQGKGLDTKYAITSMGVQSRDFNDPVHLAKVGVTIQDGEKVYPKRLDLTEMVNDKASDDFYARFIDPTKKAPSKNSDGVVAPKAAEVEPADLEALKNRLLGYTQAMEGDGASSGSSLSETSSDANYDED